MVIWGKWQRALKRIDLSGIYLCMQLQVEARLLAANKLMGATACCPDVKQSN